MFSLLSLFKVSHYLLYQPFYSVTDVIGMDCEMVGVGQGNKSALGRVSLVFSFSPILYASFTHFSFK